MKEEIKFKTLGDLRAFIKNYTTDKDHLPVNLTVELSSGQYAAPLNTICEKKRYAQGIDKGIVSIELAFMRD